MYALQKPQQYVLIFSLLSVTCGKIPHPLETRPKKLDTPTASAVIPNSYIVTFRSEKENHHNQQSDNAIKYLMDEQCQKIWSNTAVKKINGIAYLTVEEKMQPQHKKEMHFILPNQNKPQQHNTPAFIARVDFYNKENATKTINEWISHDKIIFYEPNHINHILQKTEDDISQTYSALYLKYKKSTLLWWQKKIRYFQGIKYINEHIKKIYQLNADNKKKTSPLIAILDSGVDYLHPALKNQIWRNPRPQDTFCGLDLHGCNTTETKHTEDLGIPSVHPLKTNSANEKCPTTMFESPNPQCTHGTHIAGVIAGDPEKGVPGICPLCKLIILKIVEDNDGVGKVTDSSILKALQYIYLINTKGLGQIRLINSSFGKFEHSKTISFFLANLQKAPLDILMIAAAGNENTSKPIFPAALNTTISVTALDKNGEKAPYANYGYWVDIAAPGGSFGTPHDTYGILSAFPGESVGLSQGTSVATPIVTGAAGLLLSINPNLNSNELRNILLSSADPTLYKIDETNKNQHPFLSKQTKIPLLGKGVLNIEAATQQALSQTITLEKLNKKRITPYCSSFIKLKVPNQPILNAFILFLFFLMPIALISFIK